VCCRRHFRESDGRVDVIAQYRFCGGNIAGKQAFNPFSEQFPAELCVAFSARHDGVSKISGQSHKD
jgi:hypothetical protein